MDYELTLFDRINIIKDTINKYGEDNFYLSFSGGKDSTVLHHLLDLAMPNNTIPRVFINTGIEYNDIVAFVKDLANNDSRFVIIKPSKNVKQTLDEFGYPFKSKQHSHNLDIYSRKRLASLSVQRYLGIIKSNTIFRCPKQLKYHFTDEFKIKISDNCCLKLKKEPIRQWEKDNHKTIAMTGMRKAEGGQRASLKSCAIFDGDKLVKFHPLLVVNDDFEEWFIQKNNIKLCDLYSPPFLFKRTGCKGCPFSLDLQWQLEIMEKLLPNEYKQCEMIWKPIYDEYRRLGYRLDKKKEYKQLDLFDNL